MSSSPTLDQLSHRGLEIAGLYDDLNRAQRGRVWTRAETMMGFVGDVGDLAKQVMAAEGRRELPGGREALAHELADCLWSVLILAHKYDIDLRAAFDRTMDELEDWITARLAERTGKPHGV